MKSKFNKFASNEIYFGRRIAWYAIVRATKPAVIVETGVDKGLSSVLLCSAIELNQVEGYSGFYYGIDIYINAGYLLCDNYAKYGKLLFGNSLDVLNNFNNKIDLFINDIDQSCIHEMKEYDIVKNKLNTDSIIIADNAHVTDELSKFSLLNNRKFIFFKEQLYNHLYPGGGIRISL